MGPLIRLPSSWGRKDTDEGAVYLRSRCGKWCRRRLRTLHRAGDQSRHITQRVVTARVHSTREMENCKGHSRRDEASTAGTEKAVIQRGAATVTLVVLVA